jgi:hypothetical protein
MHLDLAAGKRSYPIDSIREKCRALKMRKLIAASWFPKS